MAYNKHTWKCGEKLTIEKLNHIEDGIANNSGDSSEPLFVRYDHALKNYSYYDKTWQEVYDAYTSGRPVIVIASGDPGYDDFDMVIWQVEYVSIYGKVNTYKAGTLSSSEVYDLGAPFADEPLYVYREWSR